MKKILVAVMLLFCFASPAWADINITAYSQMPNAYESVLPTSNVVSIDSYVPMDITVNEATYLTNELPSVFQDNTFNVDVINQFCDNSYEFGATWPLKSDHTVFLFALPPNYTQYSRLFIKSIMNSRTPATLAHELGHAVRFAYLSDANLNAYIQQRGITDDERATFQMLYPGCTMNEEVFAEDFRQLFGGPAAQITMYEDNVPPPTDQDRQWMLNHITPQPPKH